MTPMIFTDTAIRMAVAADGGFSAIRLLQREAQDAQERSERAIAEAKMQIEIYRKCWANP